MRTLVTILLGLSWGGVAAQAQIRNWIEQFGAGPVYGEHFEIDQTAKVVDIIEGFADTAKRFKFEARLEKYQGGQWVYVGPGDINLIRVDPFVEDPGTVIIEINGKPGHVYGAQEVRSIDLPTWKTTESRIWWIRMQGNLGQDGMSDFDRIDLVQVGGDLRGSLYANGDITNDITIAGNLSANIVGDSVQDVTINGAGPHTGNITVGGNYGARLTIKNNFPGSFSVGGNLTGSIDLQGSLPTGGQISITGDVVDGLTNYIRIKQFTGGSFSCRNMNITDPVLPWEKSFVIGWGLDPKTQWKLTTQSGQITVSETLRGWLFIGGLSELQIEVGAISAAGLPTDALTGICSSNRYTPESTILVHGHFTSGRIRMDDQAGEYEGASATMAGAITIQGALGANAQINTRNTLSAGGEKPIPIEADVSVAGNVAGLIQSTGHIGKATGGTAISIGGNLSGAIETVGAYASTLGTIRGDVSIGGDLSASGRINAIENLDSEIQVKGSMFSNGGYSVDIAGTIGADAAIAVDWDGNDPQDWWADAAVVRVAGVEYYGTTPGQPIYDISCVKGDMNNDGLVNSFDVDPFVLVLVDGYEAGSDYDKAFAGLRGSTLYHADMDCGGAVDAFDLDLFVLRLTDPQGYYSQFPDCENCASGEASGSSAVTIADEPAAVAALFKEFVAPERLPAFLAIAQELAALLAETPRAEFWAAVLDELSP